MRRPRFTIRSMLMATTIFTAALWTLGMPGRRAERLTRLIRNGNTEVAMDMLNDLPDEASEYKSLVKWVSSITESSHSAAAVDVRRIEIQTPTIWQFLTLQRSVWIGQGWGGGDCELIVTPTTVRAGKNMFHYG